MEENGNMEKTSKTVNQGELFLEELRQLIVAAELVLNKTHVSACQRGYCSLCESIRSVRNLKVGVVYRAEMIVRELAEIKAERRDAVIRSCDA